MGFDDTADIELSDEKVLDLVLVLLDSKPSKSYCFFVDALGECEGDRTALFEGLDTSYLYSLSCSTTSALFMTSSLPLPKTPGPEMHNIFIRLVKASVLIASWLQQAGGASMLSSRAYHQAVRVAQLVCESASGEHTTKYA